MKRPNIIRPVSLHVQIPQDVWLKMTTHLYSHSEQRVPHGAYSRFLVDLINHHFKAKEQPNAES